MSDRHGESEGPRPRPALSGAVTGDGSWDDTPEHVPPPAGRGSEAVGRPARDRRASDAERQAVVDQLRAATGAGRLSLDEFSERVGVAWAARTQGDLEPLLADLPAEPTMQTVGDVAVRSGGGASDGAVESTSNRRRRDLRRSGGRKPRRLVNAFGSAHHAGGWTAESRMTVISVFGHSHVDLTTCRLDPSVEVVELRTVGLFGGIEVLVPQGTAVDAAGFVLFGGRHLRHDSAGGDGPPAMRVNVRSYGAFGSVLVRSPRRVP